jgi:hypothetical protein
MAHTSAQAFWQRVIADYAGDQYQESKQHITKYGIDEDVADHLTQLLENLAGMTTLLPTTV